jgi:hypothetical protein
VNVILSLKRYFVNGCGMQLRTTPTEKEYKEKLNERSGLGFKK